MESDIVSIAEFLKLITHVSEEQTIFVEVDLKTTFQQSQNKPCTTHWNHALYHTTVILQLPIGLCNSQGCKPFSTDSKFVEYFKRSY